MKIIAICPSIYPEKFERMHSSYETTVSKNTKLIVISKRGTITNLLNETFNKYNDGDFYIVLNDDIIFETPLWDLELAKVGTISHGNDSVPEGIHGQFLMVPGDFCRAVGWLQMPALNRYCGDVIWRFIAERLEIFRYVETVKIRHDWNGCAEPMTNVLDMERFAAWLPSSHIDIEKIRRVL